MFCRLPEGSSLPRNHEVADKINSILKRIPGVAGWVTIGGFSFLDFANNPSVSSTFVTYKDWKERGSALNQDVILANINRELAGLQEAQAFIVIPPPIRGLGQTGGFQMMVEDRENLGLEELQRATYGLIQAGNSQPSLRTPDNLI